MHDRPTMPCCENCGRRTSRRGSRFCSLKCFGESKIGREFERRLGDVEWNENRDAAACRAHLDDLKKVYAAFKTVAGTERPVLFNPTPSFGYGASPAFSCVAIGDVR